MNFQGTIVLCFLVSGAMALFVIYYLQPTVQIPFLEELLILALIEFAGILAARSATSGNLRKKILGLLFYSLGFSAIIVFYLQPKVQIGFEITFFVVVAIQISGFVVASILTRQSSSQRPAPVPQQA